MNLLESNKFQVIEDNGINKVDEKANEEKAKVEDGIGISFRAKVKENGFKKEIENREVKKRDNIKIKKVVNFEVKIENGIVKNYELLFKSLEKNRDFHIKIKDSIEGIQNYYNYMVVDINV